MRRITTTDKRVSMLPSAHRNEAGLSEFKSTYKTSLSFDIGELFQIKVVETKSGKIGGSYVFNAIIEEVTIGGYNMVVIGPVTYIPVKC